MITSASAEWVLLSELYHHVLAQSPSPESAKIAISTARKNGRLRMRAELRELKAQPDLRIAPGERAPEAPSVVTSDYAVQPDTRFSHFDWERNYAQRRDEITRSLFEYIGLVVHRDDALALWSQNIEPTAVDIRVTPSPPSDAGLSPPLASPQPTPLEIDPFQTGAPGRPTAKHLVEKEAKRRIERGEVKPQHGRLNQFARELADWWGEERQNRNPPGPRMKIGTIENTIRPIWNRSLGKT